MRDKIYITFITLFLFSCFENNDNNDVAISELEKRFVDLNDQISSLNLDITRLDSTISSELKILKVLSDSTFRLANNYSETGSYEMAIKYYHKALKISPEKPEVLYNIGVAYVYLNKFKKAEEFYKKAYAINPNDDLLKRNYSILLLALQRYREAWKLFDGRLNLDDFVEEVLNTVNNVAHDTLKVPVVKKNKSKGTNIQVPGWNDDVQPFRDKAIFWHSVWVSAGKPMNCVLHNVMKRSRNVYHFQVKKCKKAENRIRKEKLLNAMFDNGSEYNLFAEIKKIRKVWFSGIFHFLEDFPRKL